MQGGGATPVTQQKSVAQLILRDFSSPMSARRYNRGVGSGTVVSSFTPTRAFIGPMHTISTSSRSDAANVHSRGGAEPLQLDSKAAELCHGMLRDEQSLIVTLIATVETMRERIFELIIKK